MEPRIRMHPRLFHQNPDFPVSRAEARRVLRDLARRPIVLPRPVLVLAGWRALPPLSISLARRLRRVIGARGNRFIPIWFTELGHPGPMIERVVGAAAQATDPDHQSPGPVDVVAVSMGGLIARAAASHDGTIRLGLDRPPDTHLNPQEGAPPRLPVARLMTLGTPHRGATLAKIAAPDPACRIMRPGSPFLDRLDADPSLKELTLTCYARLGDRWVGARQCAPPGREPIWAPGPNLLSHLLISWDPRLVADVALRLRGEEPLGREGAPPPTN